MIKKYIKNGYQPSRRPPRPGSGTKDTSNLYKIFGIGENPPPTSQRPGFNNSDKERIEVIEPKRNKIATVCENLRFSSTFDDEVNEYLEKGWKLNKIETIKKDNEILLVGFLQRY